jgi:hypothetical protein
MVEDVEEFDACSKESTTEAEVEEEEEGAKEESEFSMDGRLNTIKRFRRRSYEQGHLQSTLEAEQVQLLQAEASKARDTIWQLNEEVESRVGNEQCLRFGKGLCVFGVSDGVRFPNMLGFAFGHVWLFGVG